MFIIQNKKTNDILCRVHSSMAILKVCFFFYSINILYNISIVVLYI